VRRHVLVGEGLAVAGGGGGVFGDDGGDGVPGEGCASAGREQRVVGLAAAFFCPRAQDLDGFWSEGRGPLFRPLPQQRTQAPVRSSMSWLQRPTSSETRSPVCRARTSRAWSLRPVQVSVLGLLARASASWSSR
jgi:hypothetical protein